jgi:hypothetical protein
VQVDSKTSTSGVVTGVVLHNGTPQITVNGTSYNLNQVTSVAPPPPAATTTATATTSSPQTTP